MAHKSYRVAYLRIAQESNAFSPLLSEIEDFERTHYFEGEGLAQLCRPTGVEVKGFTKSAELSGFMKAVLEEPEGEVEPVALFSAWAVPGGPLSKKAMEHFIARLERLFSTVGPLDGVLFSMHGAMSAEGEPHPEAIFLDTIRKYIGPKVPIAVTMDLHAQITPEKLNQIDILAAYRTNPHRDHAKTGYRASKLLLRKIRGEIEPYTAWRSLPMLLGGGSTLDFLPPMRPIYKRMKEMEKDERVLYVSLFQGHIWCDVQRPAWTPVVVTDNEPALAEQLAEELAEMSWRVKDKLPPEFKDAETTLKRIRKAIWARKTGTICVCDASDVVGTGAAGENTHFLQAALEYGKGLTGYIPIRDDQVVEQLWAHQVGDHVEVTLGGKIDPDRNPKLTVQAELTCRHQEGNFGRMVAIAVDDVHLVVTEAPPLAMKPEFYKNLGLDPWKADYVVVKSLFPYLIYFAKENRLPLYVRTKGVSDFDIGFEREYADLVHPKDTITDWRPIDRARRGIGL